MLGTPLMLCIAAVTGPATPPMAMLPTLGACPGCIPALPGGPPGITDETPIFIFSDVPALGGF